MDDGPPRPALEAASAETAADIGWAPPDWDAALREQRRAEWHSVGLVLVGTGVVLPLLRILVHDRPLTAWYLIFIGGALALAVLTWRSRSSAERRERWDRQTRQAIRVEHALRSHVSIGAADRELVTERAEEIDSWALAHFVGWPLAAVVVVAATVSDPTLTAADQMLAWLFALFCVVQLLLACRRVREARRWLDDPLPRP